jgi:hypothetical protein
MVTTSTQSPGERPNLPRRAYLGALGGVVRAFYAAGLTGAARRLAMAASLALERPKNAPARCVLADPASKLYSAYQRVSRQWIWRCRHDTPHCYKGATLDLVDCE